MSNCSVTNTIEHREHRSLASHLKVSPCSIVSFHSIIARVQLPKKHWVCDARVFSHEHIYHLMCFCLADPYFERLHDLKDEPSAELLVDEHQDATYPTQKWKCKPFHLLVVFPLSLSFNSKAVIFHSTIKWIEQQTKDTEIYASLFLCWYFAMYQTDINGSHRSCRTSISSQWMTHFYSSYRMENDRRFPTTSMGCKRPWRWELNRHSIEIHPRPPMCSFLLT